MTGKMGRSGCDGYQQHTPAAETSRSKFVAGAIRGRSGSWPEPPLRGNVETICRNLLTSVIAHTPPPTHLFGALEDEIRAALGRHRFVTVCTRFVTCLMMADLRHRPLIPTGARPGAGQLGSELGCHGEAKRTRACETQ